VPVDFAFYDFFIGKILFFSLKKHKQKFDQNFFKSYFLTLRFFRKHQLFKNIFDLF